MCTNPIHIRPKKGKRDNRGMLGYDIPCGKCPECLRQKRNDFFIRSLHEFHKFGDFGLFVTLTYSDEFLCKIDTLNNMPVFHNWNNLFGKEWLELPDVSSTSVFNKDHVQKFFKKLNEKLHYYLGTEVFKLRRLSEGCKRKKTAEWREFEKTYKRCLHYLVVCERGGNQQYIDKKGILHTATSRPHYHAEIFICYPELRTPDAIRKIKSFIRELWSYGFVKSLNITSKGKEMRSPEKAICYITKYVTKNTDTLLYSSPDASKKHKEFVLLSKFFGDGKVTEDNFLQLYTNGISVPLSEKPLNMPKYYSDKVLRKHTVLPYKHLSTLKSRQHLFLGDKSLYVFDDIHKDIIESLTVVNLTPLGEDIMRYNREKKAQYYADTLRCLKNTLNLKVLYKYHKLAKRDLFIDSALIDSISCNQFYDYILNHLYISDNFNGVDTISLDNENKYLFELYILCRDYNHTLTILNRNAYELKYKQNLRKAILQKPELFTDQIF